MKREELLEKLAKELPEWPRQGSEFPPTDAGCAWVRFRDKGPWKAECPGAPDIIRGEWLAERERLGLGTWPSEERIDIVAQNGPTGCHYPKQERYQDKQGEDWIDEFARTATVEEFRGAMRFTIGKYNRRAGKKDELISEISKMEDYCRRWREFEESQEAS